MQEKFKAHEAQTKHVHGQVAAIYKLCPRLATHQGLKHFSSVAAHRCSVNIC